MRTETQKTQASSKANPVNSQRSSTPQFLHPVLQIQQQIGNQGMQRLLQSGHIQAKLSIGQPDDIYEQQADRVADQVMRMPDPSSTEQSRDNLSIQTPDIQRTCPECEQELQRQPLNEIEEEEEELIQRQPLEDKEEEEEEEKLIQAKEIAGQTPGVSDQLEGTINSLRRGGQPLASSVRDFFEPRFARDFSQVRVHTDSKAADTAKAVNARAFTLGHDIVFGAGEYSSTSASGRKLLAHELTHVVQQGRASSIRTAVHKKQGNTLTQHGPQHSPQLIQRRPLLRAERRAAIAHARAIFDQMSVRIIQNIAGLAGPAIDGKFGRNTAQAVSDFQTANGIAADDGRTLQGTLDVMIANRVAANRRNEAIHLVTDFYNLDITTNTLSVLSQPAASRVNPAPPPASFPADTDFESGGLQVIRVGTPAFANAVTLRDTIQRELNRVAPAVVGPAAPHGGLLNRRDVRRAIRYMNRHYQDRRSIMALQGLFVGVNPTGIVDADLVQRIADEQNATAALALVDGKVGRNTLEHFFVQLRDSGNQNAAMRLVMDFYNMPDYDNLLTIYYQDFGGYTSTAGTSRNPRGPVRIRVRRSLYQSFPGVVHTLRHELEHVRQHQEGILSANTREFLAETVEIISRGMPHERLFTGTVADTSGTGLVNTFGFQDDVARMIARWDLMPAADQRRYWRRFVRARRVIRRRIARTYRPTRTADRAAWAAATPAQRAALTALLVRVNAAVRPPP